MAWQIVTGVIWVRHIVLISDLRNKALLSQCSVLLHRGLPAVRARALTPGLSGSGCHPLRFSHQAEAQRPTATLPAGTGAGGTTLRGRDVWPKENGSVQQVPHSVPKRLATVTFHFTRHTYRLVTTNKWWCTANA